jgi:hypothetical protein
MPHRVQDGRKKSYEAESRDVLEKLSACTAHMLELVLLGTSWEIYFNQTFTSVNASRISSQEKTSSPKYANRR